MKHRVMLVSDMHYTTDLSAAELKKTCPDARASVASGTAFGRTQPQKIDCVRRAAEEEHAASPLELILILGDLSIDDYDYRRLPDNYCEKFRDECMKRLPAPAYAIPGNHDSYPDDMWREMFGYPRQFVCGTGGAVFVMADTFRAVPAHDASGAGYTSADTDFLRAALDAHPDGPVFLCAHHVACGDKDREFEAFVAAEPRVAALFRGHTHKNRVLSFGGRPLIDIGGYGYDGKCTDGKWDFNIFDPAWAWGYEILEWDDETGRGRAYHRKPALHYEGTNGSFDQPLTLSGGVSFELFPSEKI